MRRKKFCSQAAFFTISTKKNEKFLITTGWWFTKKTEMLAAVPRAIDPLFWIIFLSMTTFSGKRDRCLLCNWLFEASRVGLLFSTENQSSSVVLATSPRLGRLLGSWMIDNWICKMFLTRLPVVQRSARSKGSLSTTCSLGNYKLDRTPLLHAWTKPSLQWSSSRNLATISMATTRN